MLTNEKTITDSAPESKFSTVLALTTALPATQPVTERATSLTVGSGPEEVPQKGVEQATPFVSVSRRLHFHEGGLYAPTHCDECRQALIDRFGLCPTCEGVDCPGCYAGRSQSMADSDNAFYVDLWRERREVTA